MPCSTAGVSTLAGGATINRLCGSSLQAINQASHAIIAGGEDLPDRRWPGTHAASADGRRHRSQSQAVHRHEQSVLMMGVTAEFLAQNAGHLARRPRRLRPRQPSKSCGPRPKGSLSARWFPSGNETPTVGDSWSTTINASAPIRAWRASSPRQARLHARHGHGDRRKQSFAQRRRGGLADDERERGQLRRASSCWCAWWRPPWRASIRR